MYNSLRGNFFINVLVAPLSCFPTLCFQPSRCCLYFYLILSEENRAIRTYTKRSPLAFLQDIEETNSGPTKVAQTERHILGR